MKRNILGYDKGLKERARDLPQHMTLAEVLLWNELKQSKMDGHDFDRQRPIGRYIVDFFCKDLGLAIEVDGRSHDYKEKEDRARQEALEKMGVRFLRFWDSEVKTDRGSVVERIREWVRTHPAPHESSGHPSREGMTHPVPAERRVHPSREGMGMKI